MAGATIAKSEALHDLEQARLRQRQAVELRCQGYTFEQIAAKVGYAGWQSARKAVVKTLERHTAEPSARLRNLMRERLTRLLRAHWDQAEAGDVKHTQVVLTILQQMSTLDGLNRPAKLEVTGKGGGPIDVQAMAKPEEAALAELAKLMEKAQRMQAEKLRMIEGRDEIIVLNNGDCG